MSGVYVPSFAEALEVGRNRGRNSEAPHLWDGLTVHYPFLQGGGKLLYDANGYDLTGVLTDMDPATDWITTEQRGIPWALDFAGDNDLVSIAGVPALGLSEFTISAWWWLDSTHSTARPSMFGRGDTQAGEWMLREDSGALNFFGQAAFILNAPGKGTTDSWHHVIVLRKGNLGEMYCDGTFAANDTVGVATANLSSTKALQLGCADSSASRWWKGKISQVNLWHRALSLSEIQTVYEKPLAMDSRRAMILPAAVAPPAGAIMNQLQGSNVGADLYNGAMIA